jgi:hypothetical protein
MTHTSWDCCSCKKCHISSSTCNLQTIWEIKRELLDCLC